MTTNKEMINRKLRKKTKDFEMWIITNGFNCTSLAKELEPNVHVQTVYRWKRTGRIPSIYLKQLNNLGFSNGVK